MINKSSRNVEEASVTVTHTCMRDENCWKYDDCCADAKHIHDTGPILHQFSCEHIPSNGDIYMVSTCPSTWKETLVIEKCTTRNNTLYKDVLISVPVTGALTNITYRNVFCATCNHEKNLHFWNVTIAYEKYLHLNETKYDVTGETIADVEGMLKNSHVNSSWFSNMDKRISYEPNVNPELPVSLQSRVRYCVPNVISKCLNSTIYCGKDTSYVYASGAVYKNQECAKCNGITQYEPYQIPTIMEQDSRKEEKFYTKQCLMYSSHNNQECLVDRYLEEEVHFAYIDEDTILFHELNATFNKDEWRKVSNTTIYLCGTFRPFFTHLYFIYSLEYTIFTIASRITIILLLVSLAIFVFSNKLQTLHYKIVTTLCIVLLCNYVNCELINYVSDYFLMSVTLHYTTLCYTVWSFIAFYDCWYVICHAPLRYQMATQHSNMKTFLIYSLFAFILPLIVILISLFLELSPTTLIPCSLKPGYGKGKLAFMWNKDIKVYLFCHIIRAEYILSMVLFVHTLYFIYTSKKKSVKSSIPMNYYMLFVKFAINSFILHSSFMWSAFIFREQDRCNLLTILNGIVGGSRGFFFFFAFAFPWNRVRNFFGMCKKSKTHPFRSPYSISRSRCTEKVLLTEDC